MIFERLATVGKILLPLRGMSHRRYDQLTRMASLRPTAFATQLSNSGHFAPGVRLVRQGCVRMFRKFALHFPVIT